MKQAKRVFLPGSEWLYFKIYAGNKTINKILSNEIPAIIKILEQEDILSKWFFIRYSDPDFHLRIRFLLKSNDSFNRVMELFNKKMDNLNKGGYLWKLQLDTYTRELERYGNFLIEEAESIFYVDSRCVMSIIKKAEIYKNKNYSWMIALKMTDALLNDFSYDLQAKQVFTEKMSDSYKLEFGFNQFNSKQFNSLFRDNKNNIESVLNNKISENEFKKLYIYINKRSKELKTIVEKIVTITNNKKTKISLDNLISSYIHMNLNRLFISQNRTYELILYDFLNRFYKSEIAKSKYRTINEDEKK
ncbi:MAG: thiopeptide-type bacteriocin biosynthesis protein [Paludibacteraceae bacterium]